MDLGSLAAEHGADVVCLQEIKLQVRGAFLRKEVERGVGALPAEIAPLVGAVRAAGFWASEGRGEWKGRAYRLGLVLSPSARMVQDGSRPAQVLRAFPLAATHTPSLLPPLPAPLRAPDPGQEGKHCEEVLPKLNLAGWHCTWNCSTDKKGYSGTAIISR